MLRQSFILRPLRPWLLVQRSFRWSAFRGEYDTAQDCEKAKSQVSNPYLTMPRCIASDDPRLKQQ
jgi:hypothetical protein